MKQPKQHIQGRATTQALGTHCARSTRRYSRVRGPSTPGTNSIWSQILCPPQYSCRWVRWVRVSGWAGWMGGWVGG